MRKWFKYYESEYIKMVGQEKFSRDKYIKKIAFKWLFILITLCVCFSSIVEERFGVSQYFFCAAGGFLSIAVSFTIADYKANKKFKKER